jgi:5-methylcytosine-specific restriction endonuclease McrA
VFVVRLRDRDLEDSVVDGVRVGVDPGSKTTGIAVFTETETVVASTGEVSTSRQGIWLGELVHRGLQIKNAMHSRASLRRGRRSRNLRYRAPRFNNRTRRAGWLPPSIQHRVVTTESWLRRLSRWFPITGFVIEQVRFDMQLMENTDISTVEYQHGTLAGTNVREYLLAKWGRQCAYCDTKNVPLNIDHIHPRARGGSDRVSNLTLACIPCNQSKGSRTIEEFVTDPARRRRILAQSKRPLRDAAAVNATRYAIVQSAESFGVPVEVSNGAVTKWNRTRMEVPKTHALDGLATGDLDCIVGWASRTSVIKCNGRGTYQRTMTNAHGFPRATRSRQKRHFGFSTGDHVRAVVTVGKKAGTYQGRVAVRSSGSFNITDHDGTIQGLHHRFFTLNHRADGYGYSTKETV